MALAWLASACLALGSAACSRDRAPDFRLRADDGALWQLSQQRGKAVLLTFGFTHCADTCPATMAKLARITRSLGARASDIEVALVTVDPARDSPAVLHRFVDRFAEPGTGELVGLTGTPAQIARVEAAYHVWSQGLHGDIAHSSFVFLIDSSGRLRGIRDDDDPDRLLRRDVADLLG